MDVKSRGLYFEHTIWVLQNVAKPRVLHEEALHTAQVTQIDGLPLFPLCRDSGHSSKADYGSRRRQVAFQAGNILSFNPTLGNGHCCYWRKQKIKRGEMNQQVENMDLSEVCLTPEPAFCPPLHIASGSAGKMTSSSHSGFLFSGSGLRRAPFEAQLSIEIRTSFTGVWPVPHS